MPDHPRAAPYPVVRSPPFSLRSCCPGPSSEGAGALREGAAEQRQWLEARRGRAPGPRRFLKAGPGRQRPAQRAERGRERGAEVGADLPGWGSAVAATCCCPAGEGAPAAGWLRWWWGSLQSAGFVHVSENCFERKGRCRISAIEGGEPGRRRFPWASGKGCWTTGQMCEDWRPRGDSLWLAGM